MRTIKMYAVWNPQTQSLSNYSKTRMVARAWRWFGLAKGKLPRKSKVVKLTISFDESKGE